MVIDIWSDIACPWCAIGRARLSTALESFDEPVSVRWRSFELNPTAAKQIDGDYVQLLADKYGMPRAKADQMIQEMAARGKEEGVTFDFSAIQPSNTFDAHRLLHLAESEGKQDELKHALFSAYFAAGKRMSDASALREVAVSIGLSAERVDEVLAGDEFAAEVRADERSAAELGIRGVPFFVINQKIALSGAQPPETLLQALQHAKEHAPMPVSQPADGCDDESCAV